MPKYCVSVTVEIDKLYTIEAENEESAKEIAEEKALNEDYGDNMADTANAWWIEKGE